MSRFDFKATFFDVSLNLKLALKHLFSLSNMKTALLIIPIINGSLAILTPLVVVNLSKDSTLTIINVTTTISLLGIGTVLGGIIGGTLILMSKHFKNLSMGILLKMNLMSILLSFIAFYYQNIYLIILASFFSSIFVSALNPKMGALIFNNIDDRNLATIFGGMITYFQLGDIVSRLLFSILVVYLPHSFIAVIYMILVLMAIIYIFRKEKIVR